MKRCPQCPEVYSDLMHFCPNDGQQLITIVAQDPLINQTIDGKYMIEAIIGKGGMGVVYRARHTNFDRQFAVKVLKSELITDPQAVKRFRNEANAAGAIRHPNAIAITDFNITAEGLAYLVMDYVEGRSLREIVKKEGPIPYERTVKLIAQVCDAVAAAHRKGIIHRDLKPDNIMVEATESLDQPEMVHVLDFGIAKLSQNPSYSESITVGGAILGSPYYMSPEQCDGRQLDARSDIYSIGIILYEMICGKVPFRAQTPWGLVKMHCSTPPQPLRVHRPDIIPALEAAVLKALSKDPNDRQASAIDLRRELEAAVFPGYRTGGHQVYTESPETRAHSAPSRNDAPTVGLDEELAKEIAAQPRSQKMTAPQTVMPAGALENPFNLKTTPMPALTPGEQNEEPSLEQRKLEELAKELEAEINQFRAKKDSSGGLNLKPVPSPPAPLQDIANELAEELEQFDPKKSKTPSPEIPKRKFTTTGGSNLHDTAKTVPPENGTITSVRPIAPTGNIKAPAVATDGTVPLPPELQQQLNKTPQIDIGDLAEEFSLALPEMVEDVLMSVSETITVKAEVIAKRVAEAAAAEAQAKAAIENSIKPANNNAKPSRTTQSKVIKDRSVPPENFERSRPPAARGAVELETKSQAEFKKQLILIVGGSVALIVIILTVSYLYNRKPEKPKGPQPRTTTTTPNTATQPQPVIDSNGNFTVPEGMAYMTGGNFVMGRNSDDPFESPAHETSVKAFFIDKYEVTNRRYSDFVTAAGHPAPPGWQNGKYPTGQGDLPVTGISWADAVAYCEWRSRVTGGTYRLPTEAEWEYAARHGESKIFPWGDQWKQDAANIRDARRNKVVDVGTFRQGETPEGISDLIGNVAEWTSDDLKLYPGSRGRLPEGENKVVRGGHFNTPREKATATYRDWRKVTGDDYSTVGFRCVREIQ